MKMISFLKGKIESKKVNYIEIDVNGVGYIVFVSNSENFKLNDEIKIYTYNHVREDEISLYGFQTLEDKEVFLNLISVKGIGAKSAISILSKTTTSGLIQAIETSDINYLKKLPSIGAKTAQQIILDLKGHLKIELLDDKNIQNPVFKEAKDALKTLNFKNQEIDLALSKIIDPDVSLDVCILKALQFLNKK